MIVDIIIHSTYSFISNEKETRLYRLTHGEDNDVRLTNTGGF